MPTSTFIKRLAQSEALLDGPMRSFLNSDTIRTFVSDYFGCSFRRSDRLLHGHRLVDLRRRLGKSRLGRPLAQKASVVIKRVIGQKKLSPTVVIRRLALLGLFIEEMNSGSFD